MKIIRVRGKKECPYNCYNPIADNEMCENEKSIICICVGPDHPDCPLEDYKNPAVEGGDDV